jgi:hypothetical protein
MHYMKNRKIEKSIDAIVSIQSSSVSPSNCSGIVPMKTDHPGNDLLFPHYLPPASFETRNLCRNFPRLPQNRPQQGKWP